MKQRVMKGRERDKAFIGAAIGAVTSIAGGLIGGAAKRRAAKREQRRQQKEQNRADTLEEAQALSSSYANQDYVDDYAKKVTLRFGGKNGANAYADRFEKQSRKKPNRTAKRKKAALGSDDIATIISGVSTAANSAINTVNGTPAFTDTSLRDLNNLSKTQSNRDIARQIQLEKEQGVIDPVNAENNNIAGKKFAQATTARMGTKTTNRNKKAIGGLSEIVGGASSGLGSLVGSLIGGNKTYSVKQGNGVQTSAPKTGLTATDYSNATDVIDTNAVYGDRFDELRNGGKRRMKRR